MTPKGYTTKTAIENYILQEIDEVFDGQLNDWIVSVEKIIDNITQRNFVADETASARLYDGDGTNELLIDECIAITKVEVGLDGYGSSFQEDIATGADRYFLYPLNFAAKGFPASSIVLNARSFPEGMQNNRITAKWGYSATAPADIQFAATVFVAGILNQSRSGGEQIKTESIGNYSVTYNSDNGNDSWGDFQSAQNILQAYKRILI
ncbi:TPA: hypothetical protein DEB29_03470 [Candidatus Wolfebacteria bacterium]|nr:hypothetical protein [Candidatus Wolfebacteria bacterium]